MKLTYFPCDERYKKPVGGVRVNEEFTVFACASGEAQTVFFVLTKEKETPVWYEMRRADGERFTLSLRVTSEGLYFYRFVVRCNGADTAFYADSELNAREGKGDEWQLTVYDEVYAAPSFLDGGIIYQIFPDRFNIGGERLKTKPGAVYRDDTYGTPYYKADEKGIVPNNDFFGGNLDGVTEKLDYLKSLGVKCVYLNPIFEAASNHKYDTGSYRRIDGDFGGEAAFRRLISAANEKGIKIILDGVFSHTGDDSVYFNRYGHYDSVGAFQSDGSPYKSWYRFDDKGGYECWWGVKILPCTEETDPSFNEFINGEDGIVRSYMRMGIAGWRLDVADELPDAFLDRAAAAVRKVCPDAMMLGEVWEDASNKSAYGVRRRYLQGGQLDSVTNYPFKEDILRFAATGDAGRLRNTVEHIINNYPKRTLDRLVNILGTHDTVRVLTALGDNGDVSGRDERAVARITDRPAAIRRLKLATVLQYMLPGVPCVYYGDEAGMEGFEDPFNRRCYPWNEADREVLRHYRKLGRIRTAEKAILSRGVYRNLTAADGVFAFTRTSGAGTLTVIANAGSAPYAFAADTAYVDLLTGRPFKGKVAPGEAVILKPADV